MPSDGQVVSKAGEVIVGHSRSTRIKSRRHPAGHIELLEQRRLLAISSVPFEQITPRLEVADMNLESIGLTPNHLALVGEAMFFTGEDGTHGRELWKTNLVDGTTSMVKDVLPGESSAFSNDHPDTTTGVLGDTLLFVAADADGNFSLWKSDGTGSGTVLVRQLPGQPTDMEVANGKLFLSILTELWVSDGSADGTIPLAELVYTPRELTAVGDTLFFTATAALWRSDGTAVGTQVVKNVRASDLANSHGTLYFAGDSDEVGHGVEPWKSDGTPEGTVEVKDIRPGESPVGPPGPASSRPSDFTYHDGETYFLVSSTVYKTDGTEPGTVVVSSESASDIFAFNDQLYVIRGDGIRIVGEENYITPPMHLIRNPIVTEDVFYFSASTTEYGHELWRSDGTQAGTMMVADIYAGPMSGVVTHALPIVTTSTAAYFAADDGITGTELWKSDVSEMGANVVYDLGKGSDSDPHHFTVAGDDLFFTAYDGVTPMIQLWSANGATADLIATIPEPEKLNDDPGFDWCMPWHTPLCGSLDLINLVDFEGELVFTHFFEYLWASANTQHEFELWKSDGTTAGTQLLESSFFSFFTEEGPEYGPLYQEIQDGNLYFEFGRFSGGPPERQVGRYNGGSVEEIALEGLSSPSQYKAVGDMIFFSARDPDHGRELWVTPDGFQTYQRLSDIRPGSTSGVLHPELIIAPNFSEFVEIGGQLAFTGGIDPQPASIFDQYVSELWTSDGTVGGTMQLFAINDESHLSNLTVVDDRLFFTATSQTGETAPGLWASDGTTAGTVLLREFEQLGAEFMDYGGMLYFAGDSGDGLELWRSDGTVSGTGSVADIRLGPGGSDPASFAVVGELLFFAADDGAHGREVWMSDGTAIGTRIYADVSAGPLSSDPAELTSMGNVIYFSADDGIRGKELWRSDTTLEQPLIGDANGNLKVEFGDFLRLAKNYGLAVDDGPHSGDFNRNGVVDFGDFLLLSNNFGDARPHAGKLAPVFHLDFSSFEDTSKNSLPVVVGNAVSLALDQGPLLEGGRQLDAARWQDETSSANQILIPENPVLDEVSVGAGSIVAWLNPDDGDAWNSILKTVCPDQEPCAAFGPEMGIEFNASGPHAGVFGGVQGWRGTFDGSANVFGPLAPEPFGVQPSVSDTPAGEWTHVALTWDDSGERTVYVNGVPGPRRIGGFADGAGFGMNDPGDWSIGGDGLAVAGDNPDQSRRLAGLLADLAIFELELEANQISEIMRFGVDKFG